MFINSQVDKHTICTFQQKAVYSKLNISSRIKSKFNDIYNEINMLPQVKTRDWRNNQL